MGAHGPHTPNRLKRYAYALNTANNERHDMHRNPVSKHNSSRKFNKDVRSVKRLNNSAPMRGGIRL